MKQLILVGNQKVKFQDTETIISLTLISDGSTVTIDSTKTYSVKIKNGTGYVKAITATPDTTNNMVTFSTAGFDGLPVDAYFIELWVLDTKGQTIYPSDSFIELDITANATGVQGQVVPAITLQEFEDRFGTLQSDLEAKVSTLIGPTGATGNGISGVSIQYQLGTDGNTIPTGTWSDTPSTPTDTLPYMWTRNVTTYTDGSTHTSYNISAKGTQGNNFTIQGSTSSVAGLPSTGTDGEGYMVGTELYVWTNGKWNDIVNMKGVQGDRGIQGIQGIKGDTGNGIQSTSTDYQLSSQGVEVPNTGWSTTIPVTTNALPYLWTRVTITFTDGSQHVIYFTSNKGDKGDKGDTGEKGDTGANLAVKGAVDKATSLPSTGNSEGDAYLVGTDLYVYTKSAWKDCGPIVAENTVLYNADGSLNVNGTNFNYVQDLRNGKIQYNDGTKNVQVTPMDADKEASDILAARSYTDTSVSALSTSVDTKLSTKANTADLSTGLASKADDSKVVHTSDMRKPASDVAGIEEVSTLQTQVNNSAVGTNLIIQSDLKNGYLDASTNSVIGSTVDFHSDNYIPTTGATVFTFSSPDYVFKGNVADDCIAMYDSDKNCLGYQPLTSATQTLSKSNVAYIRFSINSTDEGGTTGNSSDWLANHRYKLEKGSVATDWCPNPDDKVNVSDMRKPANDVAGIEEVNAKQDKLTITPADDSKVVHTSGDEEVSGQKTFDVAPIDKTTGNPYITKDEVPAVPSTIADTTKLSNFTAGLQKGGKDVATTADVTTAINTATANMVDSTKATNFTAGLQSGGVNVATAADLKSIEDASWHTITGKNSTFSDYSLMYKINNAKKYVDLIFYGTMGITISPDTTMHEVVDLSTIIKNPNSVSGGLIALTPAASGGGLAGSISISGTKVVFNWQYNDTILYSGTDLMSNGISTKAPLLRVTFN